MNISDLNDKDEAWREYRKKFAAVYDDANYSSPLQAYAMKASHKLAEDAFDSQALFGKVLEIGAGTGEHLRYVRHQFDHYVLTDLDEKALNVAEQKLSGLNRQKLSFEVSPGEKLAYAAETFDRVIATHVLEHMYRPHVVLKEWYRVLKNGGVLTVLIPTDPGLAWRLGRRLGPRKNALRQGISYDFVMALEHVNACNNLISILRHYFPQSKEGWWPLPIPAIDINLFFVCHVTARK